MEGGIALELFQVRKRNLMVLRLKNLFLGYIKDIKISFDSLIDGLTDTETDRMTERLTD